MEEKAWQDLRRKIADQLDLIKTAGTFYAYGGQNGGNPGLDVVGIGGLGSPLYERDLQALKSVARTVQPEDGTQDLPGDLQKGPWSIHASQLALRHPDWSTHLDKIVDGVCFQLGIDDSQHVKLQPEKLLIYEAGSNYESDAARCLEEQ